MLRGPFPCDGVLTDEHFISHGMLKMLARGERTPLRVHGVNPRNPEVVRPVAPKKLVAPVLCKRHNGALKPIDTAGNRFYRAITSLRKWLQDEPSGTSRVIAINGHDLERWCLKVLCGFLARASRPVPERSVRALFGYDSCAILEPHGLYVYAQIGDMRSGGDIHVEILYREQGPVGVIVRLLDHELVFSMRSTPVGLVDRHAGKQRVFRPGALTATRGESLLLPWAELVAMLSRAAPRPTDPRCSTLPGWSAAAFEGNQRGKDHVRTVSALVVDIDAGALESADVREAFEGLKAIIHNTRSSEPGTQCWRVIVALSRPMTPEEHAIVWGGERDRLAFLGVVLDEQTKDPSRFWFVPCAPAAGDFLCAELDGDALDADALIHTRQAVARAPGVSKLTLEVPSRTVLPAAAAARPDEPAPLASISMSTRLGRASAWVSSAEVAVAGERGHNTAMRVATAVVRGFALDHASALEVLGSWNARCEPPWSLAEFDHKVGEAERVGAMTWGAKLLEQPAASSSAPSGTPPSDDGERTRIRIDVDLARVVDEAVTSCG